WRCSWKRIGSWWVPVSCWRDAIGDQTASRQQLTGTHHDPIRFRLHLHDVRAPAGGDAEPSALAHREPEDSVVAAQHTALGVDHLALANEMRGVAGEELTVVGTGNEAHLLRVGLACNGQPEPLRLRPGLRL